VFAVAHRSAPHIALAIGTLRDIAAVLAANPGDLEVYACLDGHSRTLRADEAQLAK
jgi:hypothetical protein